MDQTHVPLHIHVLACVVNPIDTVPAKLIIIQNDKLVIIVVLQVTLPGTVLIKNMFHIMYRTDHMCIEGDLLLEIPLLHVLDMTIGLSTRINDMTIGMSTSLNPRLPHDHRL